MIFVGIARNSAVLRIAKDQLGVGLAGGEGEHRMSSDRTDRRNDSAERMKADRQSVVTLFLFPHGDSKFSHANAGNSVANPGRAIADSVRVRAYSARASAHCIRICADLA